MRRYRSDNRHPEADGSTDRDQDAVVTGRSFAGVASEDAAASAARPNSLSTGFAVGLGLVAVTTIAAKLHKYKLQGGGYFTHGAAAVIVEDVEVFIAVFALWYALRWGLRRAPFWERLTRGAPRLVSVLLWAAIVFSTFFTLAFIAIEHLYFCSTGSVLDSDALIVARKSFGPIIFIALQVEGKRSGRVALAGAGALFVLWAAALRLRRWAALSVDRTSCRRARKVLHRLLPAACQPPGKCILSSSARASSSRRMGAVTRARRSVLTILSAVPKIPAAAVLFACCVFFWAYVGPGLKPNKRDHSRVRLLRRNFFVGVAIGLRSTPPSDGARHWASAVSKALSAKVVGGVGIVEVGEEASEKHAQLLRAVKAAKEHRDRRGKRAGDGKKGIGGGRPNIVLVVLESTTGTLVTPSDPAGVSPWAKKLAARGMSSSRFYSSMPNTNKAMFQVMCGMTPSLETAWVELEHPGVLDGACLPGILRSKLGYRSLLLTGSMVGGLGVFGHDENIGFAEEEEQRGKSGFMERKVHDKFAFEHGTFEKVNYLGYDDHVVLNRSISFLLEKDGGRKDDSGVGDGGKLLTILTVGPHHWHDVPSDFRPQDFGPWRWAKLTDPSDLHPPDLYSKYLLALRYQDLFLERLHRKLDETGLSENTYVVIVGDHGEAFNEHGFDKHGNNIYEEGIRVPFFLAAPPGDSRVAHGGTFDRVGMHADIVPTLLDLLGLWKRPATSPTPPPKLSVESLMERLKPKLQQQAVETVTGDGDDDRDGSGSGGGESSAARLRGVRAPDNKKKDGSSAAVLRLIAGGGVPEVGSGLVGDSLFGPDYRGCAVSATHYGAKTLAVVAGDWKGLFLYQWEKWNEKTHAKILEAKLYDLSTDPRETKNLLRGMFVRGSCCLKAGPSQPPTAFLGGVVSTSCHEAAQYPATILRREEEEEVVVELMPLRMAVVSEVCCHLETAAVAFARDNLAFFGRQTYEQEGEDVQPKVPRT